jgi:hypothetical protein
MPRLRNHSWSIPLLVLLSAAPAAAQMGMNMGPPEFRGVLNPVVGSGAAYQMDGRMGKSDLEVAVVGKEDVGGKQGVWVEMGVSSPQGQMYMKTLMVIDGNNATVTRMIMQPPGTGPMEMPVTGMMMRGGPQSTATDVRQTADRIGAETVTTPAGTFNTEHYRAKDGSWDAWISPQVAPWGVVKSTTRDVTMTLTRQITDAKTHITGTPQRFDPAEMMRQGMGRGPR